MDEDDEQNDVTSEHHYKPPKKKNAHRVKARRKRGVYLESDGSSKFEKADGGTVNLVGENIVIPGLISTIFHGPYVALYLAQALSTPAKIVVHRNQFRRRFETTEEDLDEEGEDEEDDDYFGIYCI